MKSIYVESIALVAPGLPDWDEGSGILRNPSSYVPREIPPATSSLLSANELRRTTPLIRLALRAAEQLSQRSSLDLSKAIPVFACSDGDLQVIDGVCHKLSLAGRPVSPLEFHNIVHNAPAGYWSLAKRARTSSTSVTGRYQTFASGLLEAFVQVVADDTPVLFVCCDHPGPQRLDQYRPRFAPFASAMVLTREPPRNYVCSLRPEIVAATPETRMEQPGLEKLRLANPSARALPLLQAIASGTSARVSLSMGQSSLGLDVHPGAARRLVNANEIYARIPHDGAMRLLDAVLFWDEKTIHCSATSHVDRSNPLGDHHGVLRSVHALEYAAQAIAVHGSLLRSTDPSSGDAALKLVYVGAFRDVDITSATLEQLDGAALDVRAQQYAAVPGGLSYGFEVTSKGTTMATGKATVVVPEASA